jgi:hypothetical protein
MFFGVATAALMLGLAPVSTAQDADPSGDVHTTATLSNGQAVDGAVSPAGDKDWYRLQVETGQLYHITLDGVAGADGQTLDTYLTIYSADGATQLASNDDANGSLNSALDFVPSQSGTVFVEARGFSDDATGRYHLQVTQSTLPPDAVGNDRSTHASIRADAPVNSSLDYNGDVDVFRMSTSRGQMYRLTLVGGDSDGKLHDPMLRIVDRDGNELASNDDSSDGLNSAIDFAPQQSGDVFVEAHSYGDTGTGTYTLAVKTERLPPDPAGGDAHSAASMSIGHPIQADVSYPGDHDWYRVRLNAGQSYRFLLNGSGSSALADPLLKIHDAQGQEIATDDDGGEGLNSYLEFTAPTTATYFVEAAAFDQNATGGYTLTSEQGDIPNNTQTDAVLSADGDTRQGTLAPAGDSDWYKLTLTQGQAFRVAVNGGDAAGALSDPLVILHGPDGAEVARDDDGGPGLNALLEYQAAAAGDYYVEVRGFSDDAAGTYTLTLTAGEIGDTAETADQLTAGDEGRTSVINQDGDSDWFQINLVEGRPYRFNVVGTDPDALADPMLTIYDSNGKPVASDDDGGTGNNAYLNFTSVTGGTYYAAVSSSGDHGTGHYTISATDTDVPGNTSTDEVLDAAAGDDRVSRIEMPDDLDDYRADLEAGVSYTIQLTGQGGDPLSRPSLAVLNESGEHVATSSRASRSHGVVVHFRPTEAGSYYLQASGTGHATGDYKISIRRN